MPDREWKIRLAESIAAQKRSQRDISIKAGVGAGYVNDILTGSKDATIERLRAVCAEAGVSLFYVLGGFDITPEKEELLRRLDLVDEETQRAVLHLLKHSGATPERGA